MDLSLTPDFQTLMTYQDLRLFLLYLLLAALVAACFWSETERTATWY